MMTVAIATVAILQVPGPPPPSPEERIRMVGIALTEALHEPTGPAGTFFLDWPGTVEAMGLDSLPRVPGEHLRPGSLQAELRRVMATRFDSTVLVFAPRSEVITCPDPPRPIGCALKRPGWSVSISEFRRSSEGQAVLRVHASTVGLSGRLQGYTIDVCFRREEPSKEGSSNWVFEKLGPAHVG